MQCLNAMTIFVGLEAFPEVGNLCDKAVDAIAANIKTGKVMKVRWNACYAAGGVLKTTNTTICSKNSRVELLNALIPVLEGCPNYKVRINAALALTSVADRETFGDKFATATVAILKAMETAVSNVEDTEEIQHRTDLIDQLCTTYATLMSLTLVTDMSELEPQVMEYTDLLQETMRSALLRISPEKTDIFVEANRHLGQLMTSVEGNGKSSGVQIYPLGLMDLII